MELSYKLKIVFIIIYFILILSIERLYYDKLFKKSLEIIPKFQKASNSIDIFWKFMTFFGTKPGIGPIFLIVFLFIPLNKVFSLTFLILLTGYIDHTLKVVYRQERPLWMNDDIDTGTQHSCGYGNPSGHSLSSTCLYLSLWYILAEKIDTNISNKNISKILKFIVLIILMIIIGIILTSRLYLGVHSLNQIIFGCSLGLGIFLLFLPIMKIYNTTDEFLDNIYSNRYIFIFLNLVAIIFFYFFYFLREDIPGVQEKQNWKKMCLDQKWSKLLIKGSFFGGMSMFIILGMFIALLITKRKIDKEFYEKDEIIINWDKGKFKTRIIRILFMLIGFIPAGIIFLLNKFDISDIFFYISTPILFFCGGFLTFGPCLFYGFKFTLNKFGNNDIYSLAGDNNDNYINNNVECSNEIFA